MSQDKTNTQKMSIQIYLYTKLSTPASVEKEAKAKGCSAFFSSYNVVRMSAIFLDVLRTKQADMSQVTIEHLLAAPFVRERTIVHVLRNIGIDATTESNLLPKCSTDCLKQRTFLNKYLMKRRHNEPGL